jgi:hypothetical protein
VELERKESEMKKERNKKVTEIEVLWKRKVTKRES